MEAPQEAELSRYRSAMQKIAAIMPGVYVRYVEDETGKPVAAETGFNITVPLWPELHAQGNYWYYEEYVLEKLPFEPLFQKVIYMKAHAVDSVMRVSYQIKNPERFATCWADEKKLRALTLEDLVRLDHSCDSYYVETKPNVFELSVDSFCYVGFGAQFQYLKMYQYLDFSKRGVATTMFDGEKRFSGGSKEATAPEALFSYKDLTGQKLSALRQRWQMEQKRKLEEQREIERRAARSTRQTEKEGKKRN